MNDTSNKSGFNLFIFSKEMRRAKSKLMNYYFIMSIFIHLFILFFTFKENADVLGDKIIPIEIFDNLLESGVGEATKRSKTLSNRPSLKEESKKEKKNQKPSDQLESSKDKIKINEKTKGNKTEQNKTKNNNINQAISKEEKVSGSRKGIQSNEPDKGSLKGKGKIKITCFKCVRPIYPPIALRRGAEGNPIVKILINKNGKVIKAELISKSGISSIDNAALKAALSSTFYPIDKDTNINIEYEMKIK